MDKLELTLGALSLNAQGTTAIIAASNRRFVSEFAFQEVKRDDAQL